MGRGLGLEPLTCTLHPNFRERRRVMAAQVALRRQQEAQLKRHLAQGLMRRGAGPPKIPSRIKKVAAHPGVPCEYVPPRKGARI